MFARPGAGVQMLGVRGVAELDYDHPRRKVMTPTRRQFLASSALTLSAAGYARAADGPNAKVRVAVMGVRSRGKDLLGTFLKVPGVEVTHLVDPDANVVPKALEVAA